MDDFDTKKIKTGSFQSLGLEKEILHGLNRMGYKAPTPVQRKALPVAIAGMDIVCMARTGSGKTCVFLLPMIQKLKSHQNMGIRGLVLSPTRELAVQTFKFAKDMAHFTDLRIVSIMGGDAIEGQFESLSTKPDIIIATPGRLMHLLREISTFKLKSIQYLVFDEADRLFEMGFAEQLNEIVRECPKERQTLLFSATMPKMLVQFSRAGLRDPQLIRLDTDTKMSEELRMAFFSVRSNEKLSALMYLVRQIIPAEQMTIVFCATKHHSEMIHAFMERIGVTSTLIYGSMDQDVRTKNLKAFRDGEVSYLIVTDVAARGIDVPLLNNVINYHFPPTPKLFVHRCGRAARQGRIGFAFSLVEPEEMAFMMDVHTFLGKPLTTHAPGSDDGEDGGASAATAAAPLAAYTLSAMTPEMVHTGLFPPDVIDQENDFIKRCLAEDDNLAMLWRISENGMMQYRRTRTEASREGVKAAKAVVKSNQIRAIHPLIAGCDPARCSKDVVEKADFVRRLQTFRPAQTVFETGIGTGAMTGSNLAGKAHGGHLTSKTKLTKGIDMMKALRATTVGSLERNRVAAKLAAEAAAAAAGDADGGAKGGSEDEEDGSGEDDFGIQNDEYDDDDDDDNGSDGEEYAAVNDESSLVSAGPKTAKVRVSMAEKRKLKKKGLSHQEILQTVQQQKQQREALSASALAGATVIDSSSSSSSGGKKKKNSGGDDFKDNRFYMSYGTEDAKANFTEEAMQPLSGLKSSENQGAMLLDRAILDVSPEEAMELNKKKRVMRWDAKKRKFVKQSLEEMAATQQRGAKRMRTESGVVIKGSSRPQGEMYEKWKKRTRKEVGGGVAGVVDFGNDYDDRPRPNVKVNQKVKDELRSAQDIRKAKSIKDNNKQKNMKKDKRTKFENSARQKKNAAAKESQQFKTKAGSRRTKAILRM